VGSVGARSHGRTSGNTTNYSLPLEAHIFNYQRDQRAYQSTGYGTDGGTDGAGAIQKMNKGIRCTIVNKLAGEIQKIERREATGDGRRTAKERAYK
jgi:hypothetical protein